MVNLSPGLRPQPPALSPPSPRMKGPQDPSCACPTGPTPPHPDRLWEASPPTPTPEFSPVRLQPPLCTDPSPRCSQPHRGCSTGRPGGGDPMPSFQNPCGDTPPTPRAPSSPPGLRVTALRSQASQPRRCGPPTVLLYQLPSGSWHPLGVHPSPSSPFPLCTLTPGASLFPCLSWGSPAVLMGLCPS